MFNTESRIVLLTFEMWVVVVVTVVPLLVSELIVWDTDVLSLSSVPSSVTWEKDQKKKKGRVNNYSFLYRDSELSDASCWLWSPWPGHPRPASSTELISPLHANWLPIADTGLDWAGPGAPYLWRLIDEGLGWDDRDLCGGDATG